MNRPWRKLEAFLYLGACVIMAEVALFWPALHRMAVPSRERFLFGFAAALLFQSAYRLLTGTEGSKS